MPAFSWDAVDRRGRQRRGVCVAASSTELARVLEADGYVLLGFRSDDRHAAAAGASRRAPAALVVEALRSVVALLRAGLPLEKAISAAADAADGRCRPILHDIRDSISQGSGVADEFARQAAHFDAAAAGLIRSGERSGDLAGAIEMLIDLREREIRLRSGLLTAAIYPAILTVTSLLAAGAVILLVVPRFATMIVDAGGELPATTAFLIGVSNAARGSAPFLGVMISAALFACVSAAGTEAGRDVLERFAARLPFIGSIRRSAGAARGARVAGNLAKAGIPLVDALAAAGDALGRSAGAASFHRASGRLREGASAGQVFAEDSFFPAILSRLARAGNEVGDMPTFLIAAADALDRFVETTTRRLGIILEPLVIVLLGGVIGFVAFALFQAVYSMNAGGLQ